MAAAVVADGRLLVLGERRQVRRAPARAGARPTPSRPAPCSGCRRRPGGACRGGSASSARRSSARARRMRTAAPEARRAPRSSFWLRSHWRICSAPQPGIWSEETMATTYEEITARELKPALFELDGISRETIEAHYKLYQGYVNKRNEILGKLDGVDLSSRQPGLLRPPRAEGRPDVRDRRDQEPRDLLRAPRRHRRRPRRPLRRPRQARLRLGRRLAGRPEGDRPRRAAAGRGRRTTGTRAGSSTTSATPRTRSRSGTRRRSSRSTSTSTRTSSTSAPTAPRTSTSSSTTSTTTWSTTGSQQYGIRTVAIP